jgi:lipopolysaccharide transport system permease protein
MSRVAVRSSLPEPSLSHFSVVRMLSVLPAHRELIVGMTVRDVLERHKGAALGALWNVLQPLLQLAIYTVVFGYIFGSRWDKGGLPAHIDFPVTLFAGLAVYQVFAESMNRAPTAVSSRPNLVRKVVFPLEVLPVTVVGAALVHMAVSVVLLLAVVLAFTGRVPATALLFPLVLVPLTMLSLGAAWALAAAGVFVRDVRQVVVVLTQLLMFTTPLFFSIERVPPEYPTIRRLIELNPLSIIVDSARRTLVWGESPHWAHLGAVTLVGAGVMLGGWAVFSACRRGMADVH